MGKPKFSGAGMVDAQNSFADTTFSRNRYGTYFKAKPPTPAGSIWLAFWQVNVAACEAIWQSISDADRASWSYYKIHRKNQMAGAKVLTGHESFMAEICDTGEYGGGVATGVVEHIIRFKLTAIKDS